MKPLISRLFREPLFQFMILGLVVFGVDRYVLENMDDPRRIVIDDARYTELVDIFRENQGRRPTEGEARELMVTWAQNEVLYREALNMRLDLGDEMIRQRLILKVRDILFKNVITEAPPPDQLQAWFEENRSAYDRPELVDFEQFLVTDLDSEAAAALAARLGDAEHPQGYAAAFRRYPRRPLSNLGAAFGDDDGQRLIDGEDDQWMAVESDYGWHLARITARYAGEPADFTAVRARVAQDWLESARKQELANTLSSIVDQYDISYSLSPDIVKDSLQEAEMAARSETP